MRSSRASSSAKRTAEVSPWAAWGCDGSLDITNLQGVAGTGGRRAGLQRGIAGMTERFHVNCDLGPGSVGVHGPEAHHLAAVRRFRPGDRVCLFNGDGREYPAEIVAVAKKCVELQVTGVHEPEREAGFSLEVAAPLPKGDRAQFLLEKLTELGATSFTPLQTVRSVVHPRETKLDKLQRYVIEASKQCGRNILLRVEPLMEWRQYCRRDDLPCLK